AGRQSARNHQVDLARRHIKQGRQYAVDLDAGRRQYRGQLPVGVQRGRCGPWGQIAAENRRHRIRRQGAAVAGRIDHGKRGGLRPRSRSRQKGENDHGTDRTPLLHIETTRGAAKRTNPTRYNWMEESRLENKVIARVLWETADLMEIAAEDSFRIRSYRNGATAIEGYPERIADILRDPARKVTDIPGIGKGLAVVIAEIVDHGSCERRDLLLQKFPPTALEFLKIQGLGPKSIALIFEHYRISTMDELERLCQEQKLRVLPRMGAKLEEKVLRSIAQYRQRSGRYLLNYAEGVAEELAGVLRGAGVDSITPAGSLRRGRETVGDLDLLVTGPDAAAALDRFVAWPRVEEVLGRGENKASAKVGREGLQVDVRALPPASFGAALQYFTGSKDHNEIGRASC